VIHTFFLKSIESPVTPSFVFLNIYFSFIIFNVGVNQFNLFSYSFKLLVDEIIQTLLGRVYAERNP